MSAAQTTRRHSPALQLATLAIPGSGLQVQVPIAAPAAPPAVAPGNPTASGLTVYDHAALASWIFVLGAPVVITVLAWFGYGGWVGIVLAWVAFGVGCRQAHAALAGAIVSVVRREYGRLALVCVFAVLMTVLFANLSTYAMATLAALLLTDRCFGQRLTLTIEEEEATIVN